MPFLIHQTVFSTIFIVRLLMMTRTTLCKSNNSYNALFTTHCAGQYVKLRAKGLNIVCAVYHEQEE